MQQFHRVAAVSLFACLIGCSGRHPEIIPVDGVVRLDGKPLGSGQVTFWPASGRSASGAIKADGTFTLGTYAADDGASLGPHRITVGGVSQSTSPPNYDSDRPAEAARQSTFPAKYALPEGSGLTYEVKSDGENHVELDLKSK